MQSIPAVASTAPTPPMLSGTFLIGNALEFHRDRAALFQRGLREVGPIFGIRLFGQKVAVLIGGDHHRVFFEQTDKALSIEKPYRFLAAAFGKVGFLAPHEVYKQQRPALHSPFKAAKIAGQLAVMQLEAQRFVDGLGESGEIELVGRVMDLVQDIAAHALMGREFRERAGSDFWNNYHVISKALDPFLPPNLPLPRFLRRDAAKRRLRAMILPMIAERRAHPDRHDDFLSELANGKLTSGEILDEETVVHLILSMVFAGHETTAGQAAWTILQLARDADYLARVRAELDEKLAPGAAIDAKKLGDLAHVRWAVMESGRMYPAADMLMRTVEEELEVGGFRVPKGWLAIVTAETAHRLADVFPAGDRYDPLRFSPERREDARHRFGLIGFGGGLHKCAGMNFANNEMAIIAALVFQQLDIEVLDKNTHVVRTMGACRPSPTRIRYRRRST